MSPLKEGRSRKAVSTNIRLLRREGRPEKQAVAIALHQARRPVEKSAGFDRHAADVVYKALVAMDDDAALVFGRILVGDLINYDLVAHRDELAAETGVRIGKRARQLRRHYTREAVAKERAGQDNSHEIATLVQIGKAYDPHQIRDEHGRWSETAGGGRFVQEHRYVHFDESKPYTDLPYAKNKLGIPTPMNGLTGQDLSHYQQAYQQIQDMLAPFRGGSLNALLHLQVAGRNGVLRHEQVDVPDKGSLDIQAKLGSGDRVVSAAVSVSPPRNAPGGAIFDTLAAAGVPRAGGYAAGAFDEGALNIEAMKEFNQARTKRPEHENYSGASRAFGRLERGSGILQASLGDTAPRKLQYALAVANHVGQYGPEAQKVIGPAADRAAYRYRGTERAPDPQLRTAFDHLRSRSMPGEGRRRIAIGGHEGDKGWDPGPVLRYFHHQLPNPDLNELQRRSGVIPPSEGIIIRSDGSVAHQSVGYADDWYLPFNLKHLAALKGGDYVRTRTFGGPTTEDIYTGLVSGARGLTVVSHSGVFTVDFDRNLRGGRRFNDKAARMVARYGQLLDAVRSQQVSRGGISPSRMGELRTKALEYDPDEGSALFKTRLRELETAERRRPQLSQQESDEAALTWLGTRAERIQTTDGHILSIDELETRLIRQKANTGHQQHVKDAAGSGVGPAFSLEQYQAEAAKEFGGDTQEARVAKIAAAMGQTERFERAMTQANSDNAKKIRALQLDGAGYEAALDALQEQFPYYIRTRYSPWGGSVGVNEAVERLRDTTKDTGYVAPRFNRPQAAEAGYFEERVGQPKVEASSTRFQNFRVTGGKLRPIPTEKEVKETTVASSTGRKVNDTDLQHAADLDLLDELLKLKTFAPGAQVSGQDIGGLSIRGDAKMPTFPHSELRELYTADEDKLRAMPADELHSLLSRVAVHLEGPEKILAVDRDKLRVFKNKGKAAAPNPVPQGLQDILRGVGTDHAYPGIAYDPTRTDTPDNIETVYKGESKIASLVARTELPAINVDETAWAADVQALQTRLLDLSRQHLRRGGAGLPVNQLEVEQATKDADGLLRATQLRRNWKRAVAATNAAPAAAGGAAPTAVLNFAQMTPAQIAALQQSYPNLLSGPGP